MRTRSYKRGAFELFPKLPPEIRRQIWHETVDWRPRILPLPPIPELQVCRESRKCLLEIYKPCFQPHVHDRDNIGGLYFGKRLFPFSLYANFETNVLLVCLPTAELARERNWANLLVPEALGNLKYLAVDADDLAMERELFNDDYYHHRLLPVEFGGLKMLSFIIWNRLGSHYVACDKEEMKLNDVTPYDIAMGYDGERVLVKAPGVYRSHWSIDPERMFLSDMARTRPDWKAPDTQLARIVQPSGGCHAIRDFSTET